jgi:anti-sigma regulatory factor (Ser/Thr protein kinase)
MMRSTAVRMSDPSRVSEVRRATLDYARDHQWSEVESGQAAIVSTEMATNLLKHARDGAIVLNDAWPGDRLQIVAVDHGPGIADVDRAFADGFSTAGSPGNGLGALRRMTDSLEIFSTPDKGTVLVAELAHERTVRPMPEFRIGGISIPRTGESVCGDAWDVRKVQDGLAVLVVDGLGHGPVAAEAASAALATFREGAAQDTTAWLGRIHDALRSTRGAAAALAVIDTRVGLVRYCGVGNIIGVVVSPEQETRHLVSHNGTLGHTAARITEFTYPWQRGATLVMHSDGVSGRWRADEWPGLWQRAPAIAAGTIYRDWRRERDDATVVVVRSA